MKLYSQGLAISLPEQTPKVDVNISKANDHSIRYADEKQIQKLDQQNIINNYFQTFDKSHTEIEIKNLIAARLQPAYQLPQVHDTKALSLKAQELLKVSFSI